ncbi:MAG TPA: GNAT family N-acetyltransferase [Pyrinomonadaceae bacterium]|nr:GNAT family N-acetyltransferase [Pyrinomonadaceae bacterium]
MEIKQATSLTEAEQKQLFGWGEDIFGVQAQSLQWRPKNLRFILYDENELVSHAGILQHSVCVNGRSILVVGLGGVVTVPTARRKGFARQLVQHAMKHAEAEWHVEAGLLFCRPQMIHYYETLGWQQVQAPVMIDQPNGKIASPLPVMVLPFGDLGWPTGTIELGSLPW